MPYIVPTDLPIGTPEEIIANGGSPADWGSCAPRIIPTQQGCPHWATCIFHFKGSGPRNIGYFIQTESGKSDERVGSCSFYMQTLHAKATNPTSSELIGVVAHEGEEIESYELLPVTPGSNTDLRMKRTEKRFPVPKFPRPGEEGSQMGPKEIYDQRRADLIRQRMREAATGRKLDRLVSPEDKAKEIQSAREEAAKKRS